MTRLLSLLTLGIVSLLQITVTVHAGPLDEYYLQQFGEIKNIALQKAVLSASPDAQASARCGMPLKHGLKRDWSLLEQTTQKVLAKQLALPVLSGEQTTISPSGKFKIHYTTFGTDAVPSFNWVQTVAKTFDDVASSYTALQWQLAPTSGNVPYDVYLRDLATEGYYGITNSDLPVFAANHPRAYTSWMELDNNFTDSIYKPNIYSPLQSLQITAAHEYHHAVQYGYNFYFDVWYAEATSTWMEDELYDGVNQLYNYIPKYLIKTNNSIDMPIDGGSEYGRWILNRYLAENHGTDVIRRAWDYLSTQSNGTSDIPMLPILESVLTNSYGTSLSADFFGFAKRIYTRDWTTHTSETYRIHDYSPEATLSVYPASSAVNNVTPSISVILPHYSFAYYKLSPTSGVTSLMFSVTRDSGIKIALFKNGSEITANAIGPSYATGPLGTSDELVLLVANTTGTDGSGASISTDGKLVVTAGTAAAPSSSTSSSGHGCFIATAAYGSYLHPQVQLLRNFRDEHLLTNAPGRAFVTFYYRNSPPLADFIARHTIVRGITRLALTPLVAAVAHPMIAAFFLFLLAAAALMSLRRRINTARLNAYSIAIRTT